MRAVRRLLVLVLLAGAAWIAWQVWTWPDVAALASRPPATTAFIERWRATQRAAGRSDRVERAWVPYARISSHLKRAVLVAEDVNFFSHAGFDLGEIRQAIGTALDEGVAPRGASTITQQLAKNLWLSPSRNPLRKVKEAILTWQLERTLPKRRILELYLNVAEFGPGIFGGEAAARRYFGKPAAALDAAESAQLAASLPNPRRWHPGVSSGVYRARVDRILRRMARAEFLGHQI
jgi:monofunctional biosynthetic peptidoglycan transglycosylase